MIEKSSDLNSLSCFSILFWNILEARDWLCGSLRKHSTHTPTHGKHKNWQHSAGSYMVMCPPLSSTGPVFCGIPDGWVLLTRQWAGMDTLGTHQSNELVWRQGKGQETEIPNNIRHYTVLVIALHTTPLSYFGFSHMDLLELTNGVSGHRDIRGGSSGNSCCPWAYLQKQCPFRL